VVTTSFDTVQPGLEGHIERVIDDSLLTRHVGGAGLFATPAMIMLMELAAHAAVESALPPGHTTVGYEVCVRHVAPADAGETVVVTAHLDEVTGTRLRFTVTCAKDGGETVLGTGSHKRAIVPGLGERPLD
jgi:fluoroacetyl-CoA thioesterase